MKNLQRLGVLSTLRSTTSGDQEMHIMCINTFYMKLRLETAVQFHEQEFSVLSFIIKVSNIGLFQKLFLVHFPITEK